MQHIETIELTSSQSSITFSSIPQDYDDLVVKVSVRAATGTAPSLDMELNSSDANFSSVNLRGDGSSAISQSQTVNRISVMNGANTTANTFSSHSVYISNYTLSQNKSISIDSVTENNATLGFQDIRAMLWSNTAAITSMAFLTDNSGDLVAGSTISLYGITAGGDGTVTTS